MRELGWLWARNNVFMELLHSLSFCLDLVWLPISMLARLWNPQLRSFISLLKDPLNESDFQPRNQNPLKPLNELTTLWLPLCWLVPCIQTVRRGAWILIASAYSLMSTHRQPCANSSLAHPYLKFKSFRWALCHLCPNASKDPAHACLLEMIRAHMTV